MPKGIITVLLLCISNVFMTFAWYGHLKLQQMKISTDWP
ncbi:MAG: DMT family protein, partial [Bacteroidales bacterium]|nr:DMT family protein [Bacteroidales bacterium]